MYSGMAVCALLVFRLVWGLVGPETARLSRLLPHPAKVLAYARQLPQRGTPLHRGHNPLGALAVLLMLALVAAQAGSGLMTTDDLFIEGPLVSEVPSDWVDAASSLHRQLELVLISVVGLHVAAVLFYLAYKRQDILLPMLTGRAPVAPAITARPWWWALSAALLACGAVAAMVYWSGGWLV